MAREAFKGTLNFDNPSTKERMHRFVDAAKGQIRVSFEPDGDTRTQRQNRAWFALCVTPLAERMRANLDFVKVTEALKLAAHKALVKACLGVEVIPDPFTGEAEEVPLPTHNLSKDEFSELWERACCELAGIGIIVEDPSPDYLDVRRKVVAA